jgi:outer membrane protein
MRFRPAIPFLTLLLTWYLFAQDAPSTFEHPWRAPSTLHVEEDSKHFRESRFSIEPDRTYSLAELIDLAETHSPETRVAWENARAEAAALGIARSELYPTLSAVALSGWIALKCH